MELPDQIKTPLDEYEPNFMGKNSSVITAVTIPIISSDENNPYQDWQVIYEERSHELVNQPGEICFPGGRKESEDDCPRKTAIRETSEELSIPESSIKMITPLDVMIMPWPLVVYPYVSVLEMDAPLETDSEEVEELFTVSIDALLNSEPEEYKLRLRPEPEDDFPFERIPKGRNYDWSEGYLPELFFEFHGRTVWGITARITNLFRNILKTTS